MAWPPDDTLAVSMRAEDNQQVTVRRLPDGTPNAALFQSLEGRLLQLGYGPETPGPAVEKGDLVEIVCPQFLYLGQVTIRQPEFFVVNIEHAIDRESLKLIQQVWHGPSVG
jgi:hypothetical protein